MSNESMSPIQVSFTPEFKRNLHKLSKKYRHIKSDLQPILDQLANGGQPGDQVSGVQHEVFKVRAKNSDAAKGKSGGYRLIYSVKSELERVLVTVYSKTEQSDISGEQIRQIIEAAAANTPPEQKANGAEPNPPTDGAGTTATTDS